MSVSLAVCWKLVARRFEVDALTGTVTADRHSYGPSPADEAALEWALRIADAADAAAGAAADLVTGNTAADAVDGVEVADSAGGCGPDAGRGPGTAPGASAGRMVAARSTVTVVCAGPAAADPMLRDALAAGASRAVRIDGLPVDAPSSVVARQLAEVVAGCSLVVCGNASLDRGSASVPAFLAAELDAGQALGVVTIDVATGIVERRLDGGRRERLRIGAPVVISVEGGPVRLRRASLAGVLAARDRPVAVVGAIGGAVVGAVVAVRASPADSPEPVVVRRGPYRPRPRVLTPPPVELTPLDRILALTGALVDRTPPRLVHLEPAEAAAEIVGQLQAWGYLP